MSRGGVHTRLGVWVGSLLLALSFASPLLAQRLHAPSLTDSVGLSASPLETRFVYDPRTGLYLRTTFVGGKPLGTPIPYTYAEYLRYQEGRQQSHYWDQLYTINKEAGSERRLASLGPREERGIGARLFGPGGLKLRLQGTAELSAGLKSTRSDNPALPQRARRHTFFDFDEKIQAGVQASLGTKLHFDMNYNTASTFDFDAKKLRLTFEGGEDDIIKLIEAGQVSLNPKNTLVSGGGALFGVHTKLQLGRLEADLVVSQQRTESRRATSRGGEQTEQFEFSASNYDAHRHFFLGDFFRGQYDQALSTLPYVRSSVQITRLEVWVTNRRGRFDDARDLLALVDLGEPRTVHNGGIRLASPQRPAPENGANSLYQELSSIPALRQSAGITSGITAFSGGVHPLRPALDYEKIESARRLASTDYTLNSALGYISLSAPLASDEVLAVAYEFTYEGKVYRVGEFSSDRPDASSSVLFVKLLKGTDMTPVAPAWPLMMRNVYRLGAGVRDVRAEGFRLDVLYRDDAVGRALPYLPEGPLKGKPLLSVLGLDRLDSHQEQRADGRFDFVEGYTIRSSEGLLFFPTVEPFGATLAEALGAGSWQARYAFPELYSSTLIEATKHTEKNKYYLRGQYRATSAGEISLGTVNVTPGSVRVTAGGTLLTEGSDYSVDYLAGKVKILNQQLLSTRTPIDVSLQGGAGANLQRKTMIGVDLGYSFTKDFRLGATLMHLSELPLSTKVALGEESMKNTMWGASLSYQTKSPALTRLLNKLPFLDLSQPASFSLAAEVAQLLPGHYENRYTRGNSYLDDFESSRSSIDLLSPFGWYLASTPQSLFPEGATATDYLRYGERRARLAWFTIDPLFTRERSAYTPGYIRNSPDLVSRHLVREIPSSELYPYKDINVSQPSYLPTLSLSYYPEELGPYNLNAASLLPTGRIQDPRRSWGGIMRRIDQADFEAANIEYIEFWLMDPFADELSREGLRGGDLFIDLGDISEDILRDGKKFYENGLPLTPSAGAVEETPWGRVPRRPSVGYSFDNAAGAREKQDVGLNGLSTEEEKRHPSYSAFVSALTARLAPETRARWQADPFSPLNDPAGDDYHHYRGADYDAAQLPILERYKRYNGTEGNSSEQTGGDGYSLASTVSPDVEDVNGDYSLNELNRYLEYRISLRPEDLKAGRNFIVSERRVEARLRNGKTSPVTWYQFKVPLRSFFARVGGGADLRSVRFMRLYLTDFDRETQLRFGSLRLVRGDWRVYEGGLDETSPAPSPETELSVSSVNIEEHADRTPVSYVVPPGVSRSLDAEGGQSLQQNEQALSLRLTSLPSGDARAVYRLVQYDLRRYRRLQLFAHAEELLGDLAGVKDGDFTLFVRLGSDATQHYYEYSLPLILTPAGRYSTNSPSDRTRVWPTENYLDLALDKLVSLKRERNTALALGGGGASLYRLFSRPDADEPQRKLSVLGNPSLSNVRTLLIGVRNSSGVTRSVEVWVNELRVGDYHEESGWAGQVQSTLQLAELGTASLRAQYMSAGFGAIDVPLSGRTMESRRSVHFSSNAELGQLLPSQAKVSLPLYYSLSDEVLTPEYNPLDEDVRLSDALRSLPRREQRDSLRARTITHRRSQGLAISNASLGIRSRTPMPYDPANLSFSYERNTSLDETPDIEYSRHLDWQASVRYDYAPTFRPLTPFGRIQGKSPWASWLRGWSFTPWPARLHLETSMLRRYDEEQMRSLGGALEGERLPATFAQQFLWHRKLSITWSPTTSLTLTYASGTDARIEEPHRQVNRALNTDGWRIWQDSVRRSIREGGTPVHYGQNASLTYQLPTALIAPLSFVTSQLTYSSAYTWDRGARVPDVALPVAHSLSSQGSLESTSQLQLRQLYQKIPYLARLERKFASPPSASLSSSKKKGSRPRPEPWGEEALDRLVYTLLMVKDLALTYRDTRSTTLGGFLPSIRAVGGQGRSGGMLSPGLAFAFGLSDVDFIDRLAERGDLLMTTEHLTPGVFTETRTIDVRATLQPLRDLSITLSANHTRTDRTEVQYMYLGRPRLYGGDFTMTTIGLRGFFAPLRATEGYASASFDRFLSARSEIAERQRRSFGSLGGVSLEENAPAVLIPAFRMAYTQAGDASSVSLRALPSLLGMLPNWAVSYTGLSRLPALKKYFRSVTLRHIYRATYTVGDFSSFTGWQGSDPEGLGLVEAPASDGSSPASSRLSYAYDIPSVALQESFFPLAGLDLIWHNGLGMSAQWRRSRGLVLNLPASSLVESSSNEFTLGLNYKIADLAQLLRPQPRRRRRNTKPSEATTSARGLTLRGEYSYRRTLTLIRRIQEGYAQATAGLVDQRLRLSAEYDLSRLLGLSAYYEYSRNVPLVSTYSFPISTTSFGVSLRISHTN